MTLFNNYIYGSNEYLGRLYLIVSSLITFGLITLYSISSDPLSINSSFMRQLIFIIFSLFVFFILNQINVKTIHDNSTLIYIISFLISLALSLYFYPNLINKFIFYEGGNDGLLYVHFAHLISDFLSIKDFK